MPQKAARVWSLLKSPESDSKMYSVRIPAFASHMPLVTVLMHVMLHSEELVPCVGSGTIYRRHGGVGGCSAFDCIDSADRRWHANRIICSQVVTPILKEEDAPRLKEQGDIPAQSTLM